MFCKNCGKEIADAAFVCVNCGAKVAEEKSASEQINETFKPGKSGKISSLLLF